MAEFGGLDADAAEAAGLAHDLGHPPFGHVAEEELDKVVRAAGVDDGYDGNAQSFRIVTRLATSDARGLAEDAIPGLNWTRQTLDGILKYPWAHLENEDEPKKWGYYSTEREVFEWVRRRRLPMQRGLIAEVMDWADDVTYAIHDLTDFFRVGRIPLDRFKGKTTQRHRFMEQVFRRKPKWRRSRTKYEGALDAVLDVFPFEPEEKYADTQEHRARLYGFTTTLIAQYVNAIRVCRPTRSDSKLVTIEPEAELQVAVLKQFIWEYIIEDPILALPQQGQRRAIRSVFRTLLLAVKKRQHYLFAEGVRQRLQAVCDKREQEVRFVADYVAGMTEKEVLRVYRELRGHR